MSLDGRLVVSARDFARTAVTDFMAKDSDRYHLHAGTAIEHLCKAVLARKNRALLADPRHQASMLRLAGVATDLTGPLKTIGAQEAIERSVAIVVDMKPLKETLVLLAGVRNGVVHFADSQDVISQHHTVFLRACGFMLDHLEEDDEAFWGEHYDVVVLRMDESAREDEKVFEELLAAARQRYQSRYSEIGETAKNAAIAAIEASYPGDSDDNPHKECPACGHTGILSGEVVVDWSPVEHDSGPPIAYFDPWEFECTVCGLQVPGDLLHVSAFGEQVEIHDYDIGGHYEDAAAQWAEMAEDARHDDFDL
jgi:hypothetical protein